MTFQKMQVKFYVSLIGSGEGRHATHLLKRVVLLSTSQTDRTQFSDGLSDNSFDILSDIFSDVLFDISFYILSDISSDILSDISFDILSDTSFDMLSDISSDILSGIFLTYLLTFFLTYQRQNIASTASHKSHSTNSFLPHTMQQK